MKLSHIIGIIVIAVAIAVIISASASSSTYVSFREATQRQQNGLNDEVHVVGKLKKNPAGQIIGMAYHPEIDPNRFSFVLVDNNKEEQTVTFNDAKPQDFDKSEQLVIIGKMKSGHFHASKILMKCPSKYQEEGKFQEITPKQARM
jgi:cytochrome c-type biogenesis protein CcmE